MADEDLLRQAIDRAWTLYQVTHNRGGGRKSMILKS